MNTEKETLLSLQQKQDQLTRQCNDITQQITALADDRSIARKKLDVVTHQISQRTAERKVTCSDHAVLRYLERHDGVDVEGIRAKLASDEVNRIAKTVGGTGIYPVEGGRARLVDFTVVTFLA